MNHFRYLLLLLSGSILVSCSKNSADATPEEKQTQGYAPVSISIKQGTETKPVSTIGFDYNRSNQLTTITQKSGGETMTMEFEYNLEGQVSKAIVINVTGAAPIVYNYKYTNKKLSAIAYEMQSLKEDYTLIYDAATGSYSMQTAGSPDKMIFQFNNEGDLLTFGTNKVDIFKISYGTGKGVFADFPLQVGHFIPMQLSMLYLYFGSSHEIKKLVVSGLELSYSSTLDSKGYITQSILSDGNIKNNITSDYTYQLKNLN